MKKQEPEVYKNKQKSYYVFYGPHIFIQRYFFCRKSNLTHIENKGEARNSLGNLHMGVCVCVYKLDRGCFLSKKKSYDNFVYRLIRFTLRAIRAHSVCICKKHSFVPG